MPPTRNGQPRRGFPVEILTDDEVRRLLNACSCGPTGVRNRALIATLYRSGLRINEALDLFPKDIDREEGSIRILTARVVGLGPWELIRRLSRCCVVGWSFGPTWA